MSAARTESVASANGGRWGKIRPNRPLSAGTPDLLAGTGLRISGSRLILRLDEDSGVFAGESVMRRLDRLAQAVGLEAVTETARERAA